MGKNLERALCIIQKNENYRKLVERIAEGEKTSVAVGSAARAYLVASLFKSTGKPMLIITPGSERAKKLAQDIKAYSAPAEFFPEVETMPYDSLSPSAASVGRRFALLDGMESGKAGIWITPIHSAMRIIPPASAGLHRPLILRVGQELDLYDLAHSLTSMGYVRVPLVEAHGHFSLRGDIIDIFVSNMANPVRVEFFGDEIESIRIFSAASQRSTNNLKEVYIYGCRQITLARKIVERSASQFKGAFTDLLEEEIGKIKDLQYFEGIDKYLPFFYEDTATILDYLPQGGIIIVDEPEETAQTAELYLEQQFSYVAHLIEQGAIISPPQPYFREPKDIIGKNVMLELASIGKDSIIGFAASPVQPILGRTELLEEVIKDCFNLGLKVVIALPDENQLSRMVGMLTKLNIAYSEGACPASKEVGLTTGDLSGGFTSQDIGLAVISGTDIFGRKAVQKKAQPRSKHLAVGDIADLKIGDYVVHSTHGIATYAGLHRREVAGVIRDYAVLEYAGGDRLFVPTDQLDRITRYIGAAGETPTISRLGGSDWIKAKRKAKAAAKKVAYDLLSLYAERSNAKGFAFSPDTPWQKELEDSFIYDETPDQLAAVEEVKRDMEAPKPMDRLICGDVGYGKTEVAVRAAFKAAVDGKQVVVLVPTTILAQQHFTTFTERLQNFPITVEMVSRFKSQAEQKDIIKRFGRGQVDILIGTHRLLSKDVKPFDLGLVIIDEEQRFGVNDKEKLREFKKTVDVLTLSATPIPRTLQISLAGIRDMSVIETPPEERQPIITHVGRFNEEMLVQAVRRELGRGGQVYLVHNRVETITRTANRVQKLIPEARVAVAHGQMSERQLEKIMLAFLDKKYDVLVCTTIIESGIDIPSVNTLIVDRAELLGLAQLYQLRGRVGRSSQRAYAYFFFSPQKILTLQAFERLKTINEFTELGSGMKIALRDLEIRGAGNLLGAEQHGHMAAVGFELYCQLLKEAIEEYEGKPAIAPAEIKIDLPVSAYIPESYIPEESLRIEAYQKIIAAREDTDIEGVGFELKDRYGMYPEPVERLLDIAKLRLIAKRSGINEISYQGGRVKISPIRLDKQQERALNNSYDNLIFRPERWYLQTTKLAPDETIAFLLVLFGDIMGALTAG
ncbi:MAG: transcription-repair coupling factor [Firmicutes bacterium]|nr:transcription-repair coupling factor [Bacillota bacterium]